MSTEFIDDSIWHRLRQAAKKCRRPALVAVAYFGRGAAKLLPLRRGSRLVVDASELTVKQGLTCPADLLKLQKRGVRIFSVKNLHAKVFIFGGQAFIGSSNASRHSASRLKEAVLRTTEREAVNAAKAFVLEMCKDELGPESLKSLKKLYRPPKFPVGIAGHRRNRMPGTIKAEFSPLRLVKLELKDGYPEGSESAYEAGLREARSNRKYRSTHSLDEFEWASNSIRRGDTVIQIVDEGDGPALVTPPGRVTNIKQWSNGRRRCTFVFLEVPKRRRVRIDKLATRLGRGAKKRLDRSGFVSSDFADKLREAWRR